MRIKKKTNLNLLKKALMQMSFECYAIERFSQIL